MIPLIEKDQLKEAIKWAQTHEIELENGKVIMLSKENRYLVLKQIFRSD
jgi:hypothetical protein